MKAAVLIILGGLLVPAAGCGEVTTLDTSFTPSLGRFVGRVQPVLDAQTCGRKADEAKGLAGCHDPEQGGLELRHRPDEEQMILNYRAAVSFVDLHDPSRSPFLLAPLNGPLPPDGARGGSPGTLVVDHPDYAGRFTSTDDCCYCTILLWICGDDAENPGCAACQPRDGCGDCQPVTECQPGGAPQRRDEDAAVFQRVVDALVAGCGGCHASPDRPPPPGLKDEAQVRAMVDSGKYLTPCAAGGKLLRYVDGNNNDRLHSNLLDAEQRDNLHVWVEELGAPTP